MTSQEILDDIRKEVGRLTGPEGVCVYGFEFSLISSPLEILTLAKTNSKTIIWYEAGGVNSVEIYKKITAQFVLPYNENLRGQYL